VTLNPRWLAAFGSECWYCGTTLTPETGTVDHRIPICRGGSRKSKNLVPACGTCNRMKNDKTEEEFLVDKPVFAQRRKFQPISLPLGPGNNLRTIRPSFPNRPCTDRELQAILVSIRQVTAAKSMERITPTSERRQFLKNQFRQLWEKRR
jgi:hypothetical protein